jgi:hypothetical protein
MRAKTVKYYQVTNFQLFFMGLLMGVVAGAIIMINTAVKEYLQLPVVTIVDNKCAVVENYKNGEAFTCGDVGTILRNYRKKPN